MLAEGSFSEMTIRALSSRAGVNHNTFYYHYDSLDDMAERLFQENVPRTTLAAIARALRSNAPVADAMSFSPEEAEHVAKAQLFARSESPFLTGLLRSSIWTVWLGMMGVEKDTLTADELIDIDFAVGGEMALMRQTDAPLNAALLARFAARPLGQGVFTMLSQLENRSSTGADGEGDSSD